MTTEPDCPSHIEARERLEAALSDWWVIPDDYRVLDGANPLKMGHLRTLLATPTQEPQPRGWPTREEVAHAVKDVLRQYSVAGADLRKVTDRKVIGNAIAERVQKTFPPCETAGGEVERADPGAGEAVFQSGTFIASPPLPMPMPPYRYQDEGPVGSFSTTPSPASTSSGAREDLAEGREHLTVTGQFQSDKYPWAAAGFVPLKTSDPTARDLLAIYAERRRAVDASFADDLLEALGPVAAPGAPEGWREIAHPHRPPSAITERDYLHRQIERVGEEGAVVGTLCTSALAADSRGSFAGYLWAIAEWAQAQIVKKSEAALTSSSAKPCGEELSEWEAARQRDWAALRDGYQALAQSNRRLREGLDLPISWELSWGEVSDEEGADCGWRVHERSGNRSDREWTLIATGETPLEALTRAAALKDNGHG